MPQVCSHPGCPVLTTTGQCAAHRQAAERARPMFEMRRLYRTARWRRLRAVVLSEEPLCMCDAHRGLDARFISAAVDHRIPHRGDETLFWDRANLRGLAEVCHNRKTGRGG
jgi:5-methylcytosine-specific restriction protein A